MTYTFSQLHAIKVLNIVVARLDDLRNATNEIIDGVNRGKLQHCKARRQFREIREDTDRYFDLACKITAKYFDCKEEFYEDTIKFGDWWRYFDAVNAYFRN